MMSIFRSSVKPGEWHKPELLTWHMEMDYTGVLIPVLVCDQGHEAIIRTHKVNPEGVVTPSIMCPVEGCTFHEYVKLEGWERGSQN